MSAEAAFKGRIRVYPQGFVVEITPEAVLDLLFFFHEKGPRMVAHAIASAARGKLQQTRYADVPIAEAKVAYEEGCYQVELRKATAAEIANGAVFMPWVSVHPVDWKSLEEVQHVSEVL
jgi:hypothetical protein